MNKSDKHASIRRKPEPKKGDRRNGLRTSLLAVICGLVVVSGFIFAARQHFSSMEYGMRNAKLRRQVDQLEAEKRRLLVARESSMSPAELKKAAKKAGIADPVPAAVPASATQSEPAKAAKPEAEKPLVVKTASVASIKASAVQALLKPGERPRKAAE